MKPNELIAKIENGELDKSFKKIYVSEQEQVKGDDLLIEFE